MPACHHRPKSQSRHHNRSTSHHHQDNRYRCSRSRTQSHPHWYHSKSHHDSYRGHSRSHHRENRRYHRSSSWHSYSGTLTHCSHCNTPHHRSSSHRSSSVYSRDHIRSCSWSAYKPVKKTSHQSSSQSRRSQGKIHTKRNPRVTIDDPQMDFYSSDDHSSDSEEDSDHLNYLCPLSVVHPMKREGQIQRKQSQWHVLWIAPPLQSMLGNATKPCLTQEQLFTS